MRIQCSGCKKMLEVPDKFAGKQVQCPVCKQAILVPEAPGAAAGEDLVVESAPEPAKPAPRTSRRLERLKRASSRKRAEARRELAALERHAVPSAPPAPPSGSVERCPSCSAPLIAGAVLCTFCGYDLRAGKRILAPRRPVWPRIKGLLGPLAALALAIVTGYWLYGRYIAIAQPRQPGQPAGTPATDTLMPEIPKGPARLMASAFGGGDIAGEALMDDTSLIYRLAKDVRLLPAAVLKIGAGVRMEGSGGIVGAGNLIIEARRDALAEIGVPVRLMPAEGAWPVLEASGAVFRSPVTLRGPQKATAADCDYRGGLTLDLAVIEGKRVDVALKSCRLAGSEPVLALNVPGNVSQMTVRLSGCDIMGAVSGRLGPFSAVDFAGNYWAGGVEAALAGFAGEGEKTTQPVMNEPQMKELAGAVTAAAAFWLRRGPLELPVPTGWKAAGTDAAWQDGEAGSLVVRLLDEPLPAGGVDTFLNYEKGRAAHMDRSASLAPLDTPLAAATEYSEHLLEFAWREIPYKLLYHLCARGQRLQGVAISLPAARWDESRPLIEELLKRLERKG